MAQSAEGTSHSKRVYSVGGVVADGQEIQPAQSGYGYDDSFRVEGVQDALGGVEMPHCCRKWEKCSSKSLA